MPKLTINLLGIPAISLDQRSLDAQTYKATALLAYLAINQQPHIRLELATLLWTELDKDKALAALRTTLWKLKQAGLEKWLRIHRDRVQLAKDENMEVDVLRFQDLIAQCETHGHHPSKVCPACLPPLGEAVELYHGDFMKGFSLRDAGEFDNWQSLYNEILRKDVRQALEKLVKGHRSQGEIERSIFFARRWISFDRYNEDIYRQLMHLYVSSGLRSDAIQTYHDLAKLLHRESMEPQLETTLLYNQIQNEKTERILSSQELAAPVFVATDIEKSDELWAHYREQMIHTVARYSSIVKECATQFGGHVMKQSGDAIVLAFVHGQPLHCVLAIHKRLMRATWTVNTIPRIRIAINAAEFRQASMEDYLLDIHRAEQLLTIGWGGQVLLTAQVLKTVDQPEEMRVNDLGLHVLKNLGESLRVYMAVHPTLPSREFPPLQSLSNFRQNLPNYPTTFINRDKEQAELAELLRNEICHLITLVGPGGVGKTRLALQVAAQQMEYFKDGVYFVPVAAPKTPDLLPSLLAETLKINFFEQKEPLSIITDFLREKNMLLVIDNFEHLSEGTDFVSSLLNAAPGLKIIVTSRARLDLHEEWIYELHGMAFPAIHAAGPLDQYSSVQLFTHNAQRVLAGFTPSPQDLEAIGRICRVVDGIPLAIELATAWIRTLSCEEIADNIEANFDFLSTTMRDLPARHRSLRAVFEHSWNLLSEEGRRTYRKLAVFRNGFTANAALQVAKTTPIMLASFIDRSMLQQTSPGRFGVVEVLRHFAEHKLHDSPEDYENTSSLHSTYYCELLSANFPGLMSDEASHNVDIIRTEFENIRTAWEWAVNHERWSDLGSFINGILSYLEITGHFADGLELYSYALKKLPSPPVSELEILRTNLLLCAGWVKFCLGNHAAGMRDMYEVLESYRKSESRLQIGVTYQFLARANERLNLPQLVVEQAERALQIFKSEPSEDPIILQTLAAQTLQVYGLALLTLDRMPEAKKALQECLRISRELGQRFGSVHAMDALGRLLTAEGDHRGALSLRIEALKIARETDNKYSMAILLNNLCHAYTELGDYEAATQYQQESIRLSREIGHRWLTAIGLNNLAYIHIHQYARFNEAIQLYQEAFDLFSDIEDPRGCIYTLYDMGAAALETGLNGQAYDYFLDAINNASQTKEPEVQLYCLSGLARVFMQRGQLERAYELCHLVSSHPQSNPDSKQRTSVLMTELETKLTPTQLEASRLRAQSTDLEQVVSDLISKA